jgi:heavy metal sensor kinase
MSLTGRLTAFFLTALAVVLLGFSAALYLLARNHLYRELDARLDAALDALVAAVEFKVGGVEWDPDERRLTPGQTPGADAIHWLICDDEGQVVDLSPNLKTEQVRKEELRKAVRIDMPEKYFSEWIDQQGQCWRALQRRIQADSKHAQPAQAKDPMDGERIFPALVLAGAASQRPVQATLSSLGWTLGGLSAGLWSLAALLGRRLCKRALVPVTRMAAAARSMSAAHWEQRLPVPATKDELEELARSFNDLLARLHEAFVRQSRFTGDASHQLRTPLTAMLGQMEVSLRRNRPAEEYRQVLELVHGQAVQLHQIVEMLLFLARADVEAELPNMETVDLSTWLDAFCAHWSEHPRAGDLRLEVDEAAGPVRVRAQPRLLEQLFQNLVDNALKYSQPGTPVILRLERGNGTALCSVEDCGCGIAGQDLPHVFEPFYRATEACRCGCAGVGLGLAVVQRIAHAFGGTVRVRSELGQGSCFTFELPEVREPREARMPAAAL